jgi:type III secretion system YscQ/HrcQ family protein
MKADSKETAKGSSANADPPLRDPFAVDMFTSSTAAFESSSALYAVQPLAEIEHPSLNPSWHLRLPRIRPDQAEASAAIASLPLESYSQVKSSVVSVLSRYAMQPAELISVSLLDLHETDFLEGRESSWPHGVFATFAAEPNATSISFEVGARFAAMLVDRILGGDGVPPDILRSLTRTERAVIEFLCLSAAGELNIQTGEPLLRLQGVSDQPPWATRAPRSVNASGESDRDWQRGLVASFRIGVGEISGITRAYLNLGALPALEEARRRLRSASSDVSSYAAEELARYARVAPDLGLNIVVGKTEVTPQELLNLEAGDVMVVDWPSLRWRRQQVRGSISLRVGDSDEVLITAEVTDPGDDPPEDDLASLAGSLKVRVETISIAPTARYAERVKMEEETENAEAPADGGSLIEAVMLTVRVELAARRLRLDELSRLRANQILDLGCKATDPVDLIVDGRRVGRGELVDIEGRLGVRITQVLV